MFQEREKERIQEIDYMNYLLGKYIGYAVNDPKKYPRKPFLDKIELEQKKPRVMSSSDMERIARANTLKLGGELKTNGNES